MRRLVLALGASVVLVALGAAMQAQPPQAQPPPAPPPSQEKKPEAPAATPAQQDRVDISGTIDSWYKIEQADRHVGFVHEILSRVAAGSPWRFDYTIDAETEFMVQDPKEAGKEVPSVQSLRVKAKLDDTYMPVDWHQTNHSSGVDIISSVSTEESGIRKIEVVYSATDRKPHSVPPEDEVYYSRSLMFISLRQNQNLSKPGSRKVFLFDPQTQGKAPLAEVILEIGQMTKREYMGKKEVPVTRIAYLKPPPALNRDFELVESYIDKFGRVVEDVLRGGMRTMLVKSEEEAIGKGISLRQGARRDPFRKDLALTVKGKKLGEEGGDTGGGPQVPRDTEQFQKSLADALKLLDELKKAKDESREADGEGIYQKILDYHAAFKKSLQEKPQSPEIAGKVDTLRRQAEEIWQGADRVFKKLRVVYARALERFDRDECEELGKAIEELRKGQDRRELQETPQLLEVGKWLADLEPKLTKCRTRLELARKRLVLAGTTLYEDWMLEPVDVAVNVFGHQVGASQPVRFIKPSRVAIINDKIYRVGDVVEQEGVRVEKIWSHGVQVSLREETRDVSMRQ